MLAVKSHHGLRHRASLNNHPASQGAFRERSLRFHVRLLRPTARSPPATSAFTTPWSLSDITLWAGLNLTYYGLLCTAALAKSKKTVGIALVGAILLITGATALFA